MAMTMELTEAEELPRFRELVVGSCEDVPPQESNTVRLFISSTFTDMIHERNKLTREVYPKLQRYCLERGLDFEAVDMRWGVHDNITTDHKTTELCMLEIDQCRKLSQGPCFVAFLGNKYGYRPLCATIEAEVFDKLCELMDPTADRTQMALLRNWYRRDDNSVPPLYLLQPITSRLPHFDDNSEHQATAREDWRRVSLTMRALLTDAARLAVESGVFSYDKVKNFFSSVTEQEVLRAFDNNRNPESNIVVFTRELEGIENSPFTPKKRIFIDCDDNGDEDQDAQALLKSLKEEFIPSRLPPSSIHKYTIPWREGGVDPNQYPEYEDYLTNFTRQFHDSILSMIDVSLKQRSKFKSGEIKAFYEELIHHYSFQQEKCRFFKGRKNILDAIQRTLKAKSNRPCILHGVSGSGKTSVMAMFAKNAHTLYTQGLVCVLRFLGTSPLSSSIRDTILTVCQQICYAYNLEQPKREDIEDFHKLDMFFKSLLVRAPTEDKPLLLLLDSIDQLSPTNSAYSMNWLPLTMSRFAHVLVSMLPEVNGCLSNMRKLLMDQECYVEMTPVEQNLGLEIVDSWLEQHGRRITEEQRSIVSTAITNCPQPLYLKILFEEFSGWTSYEVMEGSSLPSTVRAAITRMFEELERNHGELLVDHTLGFLTAGRQGITEVELKDVLSCDDEVLNEVYQYWDPPVDTVVRLPTSVWKRIRFDIQEFLAERQAGGKTVIGWYHRQFIEAARDRYLGEPSAFQSRNSLLGRMYLDDYREGKVNPIKLVMRGKSFPQADRQVAPQPLEFERGIYNLRKLQELPYHLSCAKDIEKLKRYVVYNFDWLFAKLSSCSFTELITDVGLPGCDSELLEDAMLMSRSCVQMEPRALAGQLIARIGDRRGAAPYLSDLLEQCEQWTAATSLPLFVPRSVFLKPPGGPMVTTFGSHPSRVLKVAASECHQVMISACEDDSGHPIAFLWDIKTFELIQDVHVPNRKEGMGLGTVLVVLEPGEEHFVFGSQELGLFKMSNGSEVYKFQCLSEEDDAAFNQVQFIGDDRIVGLRKNACDIFVWDNKDGTLVDRVQNVEPVKDSCLVRSSDLITASSNGMLCWWSSRDTMTCDHSVKALDEDENLTALTSSGDGDSILISGDKSSLQLWESSGRPSNPFYKFPAHSKPANCMFTWKNMVAVGYLDGTVKLWNLTARDTVISVKTHRKEITCFSSVGELLVVGSLDDTLTVWSKGDYSLVNKLEGHSSWIADVATVRGMDGEVKIISASNDRSVILWNPCSKLINNRERHSKQPTCIAVTEDGNSLFSGSSDGTVKHWDFCSGKCLQTWEPGVTTNCLLLIEGDRCLVGGLEDGRVKLWDIRTRTELEAEDRHGDNVTFLRRSSAPERFLSGSKDKTVKIWLRGKCIMTLKGHADTVTDGGMTSDGREIVISGAADGKVRFWGSGGQCLTSAMHCRGLECVVISHNNQYVVTGSKGETMMVWSLAAGTIGSRLKAVSLTSDSVKGVAFTHDDRFIVSGIHTAKRQLHKWDFLDAKSDMYFDGHTHAVMCLYVTSNDKYLITGSRDCTLKAWDLTSGRLLAGFYCASQIKHFAVAEVRDGHYRVAAANKTGEMALFDVYLDEVVRVPDLRMQSPCNGFRQFSELERRPVLRQKMSKKSKICGLV